MSHQSRPRPRGLARRRLLTARIEATTPLEERQLLAPFVSQFPTTATFTAFATQPKGVNLGSITVNFGTAAALPSQTGATNVLPAFPEAAAITSVSELTPTTSFGGDIVRIRSGPGGD